MKINIEDVTFSEGFATAWRELTTALGPIILRLQTMDMKLPSHIEHTAAVETDGTLLFTIAMNGFLEITMRVDQDNWSYTAASTEKYN